MSGDYDLLPHSESLRRTAAAWLLLGLASLVGAGLFSLLLVLARTPAIQPLLPVVDLFRVALVIHVNLSVLIWLLAIAGVFWSLACRDDRPAWDRLAFWLAAAGTVTVALSPLFGAGEPVMNNYVPVLRHPAFYAGMLLFASGIVLHLVRCSLPERSRGRQAARGTDAMRTGSRLAAAIAGTAALAFLASLAGIPGGVEGIAYYELLFWGGGHVLQFTHMLLMILAWIVLASASGCRIPLSPGATRVLLCLLAAPVIAVPLIYLAHEVTTPEHRLAFTSLMKYGGLLSLPLGFAVLVSLWRAHPPRGEERHLRAALAASIALFATGGVLGFMIAGLDIVIPAHYHGSTVGVTIAFMGLTYYLLPRLGFGAVPQRPAFWQSIVYGGGQLMHIAGLAWSGGYGVQRKTLAIAGSGDGFGEFASLGLMGLGGLVSVAGGLMFLLVAWRAIREPAVARRLRAESA